MKLHIIFFIVLICFSGLSIAMKKRSFSLKQEQKTPIISLLDEAVYLHHALYSKQTDKIDLALLKVKNKIKILEASPNLLPYQQQSYIYKLLRDIKPKLEAIKISQNNSKKSVNSINRTFTYMAHVYGLKKYATFFCSTDRSIWMQKKNKLNKPLHLDHQLCGSPIGK